MVLYIYHLSPWRKSVSKENLPHVFGNGTSYKNPIDALFQLPLFAIAMLVGVIAVELMSRLLAKALRRFPAHPYCEQCGYWLRGLSVPRCPECGEPFLTEQLHAPYVPEETPFWNRWTTWLAVLVLILTVMFPFSYREATFHSRVTRGREMAEQDWARGTPTWYVTTEEFESMSPQQAQRVNLMFGETPSNGFSVRMMWRDWARRLYQAGYRETIERKLRETGQSRPSFD